MAKEKLILLGLNEINFEYIEKYIQLGYLPYNTSQLHKPRDSTRNGARIT